MTMSAHTPEVVFEGAACELAFRASQVFEKVLTERAVRQVKEHSPDAVIVTVEDVRSCIDAGLIDEVGTAMATAIHELRNRRLSA